MNERNPELERKIIDEALKFTEMKMKDLSSSHGLDHVQRVLRLSEKIGEAENADLFIVKTAAILHDIAREGEDRSRGKTCHAELGSAVALDFLINKGLDKRSAGEISLCIKSHRYRNSLIPHSIEAKVLYDADKLDSTGAIGIGRAFLFAGEVGAKLHNPDIDIYQTSPYTSEDTAFREYIFKLRHLEKKMLTAEGKRLARGRHEFMEKFFERLHEEFMGIA